MSWNYRLVRCDVSSPTEPWYEMREVYYDEAGEIMGWTAKPVTVTGNDPKEIAADLILIRGDLRRREILLESDLRKRHRQRKRINQ
jgi:hypothetical protein